MTLEVQTPEMHAPTIGVSYLEDGWSLRSWLTTTDHKRIAILYLISITALFFLGGAAIGVVRLELLTPKADLVRPEVYNRLFTTHGVIMVWFFLIPSIPAVLGNFLVPLMLGARDLAFPRLNLLSWYLFVIGALVTISSLILGGVDTGWTFYTPYSSAFASPAVVYMITGIFIAGFASILTGLNFIVTTHTMRASPPPVVMAKPVSDAEARRLTGVLAGTGVVVPGR